MSTFWIFLHETHECLMDPDPSPSQDCVSSLLEGGGGGSLRSALGINDSDWPWRVLTPGGVTNHWTRLDWNHEKHQKYTTGDKIKHSQNRNIGLYIPVLLYQQE